MQLELGTEPSDVFSGCSILRSISTGAAGADCTIRMWSVGEQGTLQDLNSPSPAAAAADANGGVQRTSAAAAAQDGGSRGDRARPLACLRTKATPVVAVQFSRRNLLLGGGALTAWPGARRTAAGQLLTQSAPRDTLYSPDDAPVLVLSKSDRADARLHQGGVQDRGTFPGFHAAIESLRGSI